jgi:hypothetical protein
LYIDTAFRTTSNLAPEGLPAPVGYSFTGFANADQRGVILSESNQHGSEAKVYKEGSKGVAGKYHMKENAPQLCGAFL